MAIDGYRGIHRVVMGLWGSLKRKITTFGRDFSFFFFHWARRALGGFGSGTHRMRSVKVTKGAYPAQSGF
jgi:hypothetical protein